MEGVFDLLPGVGAFITTGNLPGRPKLMHVKHASSSVFITTMIIEQFHLEF